MLFFELPFVVALLFWARWVGGKYGAPRWVRWSGWAVAAAWAVTAVVSIHGMVESFGAVRGESVDPAQKARALAEGISGAMHAALMGIAVIASGIVFLLVLTWRYHWSAKPEVVPREPPYR